MWNSIRRSRAANATRSRRVGVAVAVLACVGLAACTATAPSSPASTAEADTIAPFPQSGVIDAGTYLVTGYPVPFEITVPEGWETFDGAGLGKDDPDLPDSWNVAVLFWPATYVPTDACAWQGALVQVDPTAEAFVDAMTAQASTVGTPPVEVVVGNYSGFEFDYAVEGDVDIADCDGGRFCVYSNSAEDCNSGRVYAREGERETYRVVDLNGERAVIAVGQSDESIDPALIEEARAIFDSIEFVGPDYVLELESVGTDADKPKDNHGTLAALGLNANAMRRYEDVGGLRVWSGESDDGTVCLLVAHPGQGLREGIGGETCSPKGSYPIVELRGCSGCINPPGVFADLPASSVIRFALKCDHVDVYVNERVPGPNASQC